MTQTAVRHDELKRLWLGRRREIQDEVQMRLHGGRAGRPMDVRDDLEHSDADSHGDVELALLQMRAESLVRIDEALVRLDAGEYGACVECATQISTRRLRALPFAVRCQACQERQEQRQGQAQELALRRAGLPRISDVGIS